MRKKNINYVRKDYKTTHNNEKSSISLPTPAMLESYEEIYPGFTEKLLDLVKNEQEQRRNDEHNYIKSVNLTVQVGQILAFLFSALVLAVSVALFITQDHYAAGTTIFITWFTFLFLMNKKVKNTR